MTKKEKKEALKRQCKICEFWYSNESNLRVHVDMVHGGKKDHECPICDKRYSTKQVMDQHMKREHN